MFKKLTSLQQIAIDFSKMHFGGNNGGNKFGIVTTNLYICLVEL
ncbi:hypothetical protein Riean_0166 [Riemerella anatipestifer ATCC 11845 = DSM 15868]|uniref:Uncharacterized protein n=1 Tax=Riemerella anatipestifer (strain ATCC 11845 / DSM 15868 / JCM 9532 / NCTC 11014) TaxID=693978 RepID=E4TBA5_RIEAD|nr:hypothetical protein Riean_0166 [Riemerella anatipestifer ATCC 11845 = DSM 15868]AFD55359.1 hypothetical protein RA0C_0374 [Riemerella anatipestifer ATCC 11845 = DSM 15868]SNV52777.1 Uncharacterised protein [Riemerella anatipestifer]